MGNDTMNRKTIINSGYIPIVSSTDMPTCTQMDEKATRFGVAIQDHRNPYPFIIKNTVRYGWEVFIKDVVYYKYLVEIILSYELEALQEQADWCAAKITHLIYKQDGDRRSRVPKWVQDRDEMCSLASIACENLMELADKGIDLTAIETLTEDDICDIKAAHEFVVWLRTYMR